MKSAFEGISVLRWHYGMVGQPKATEPPPLAPLEKAFALALGTTDPANFECLCPVLLFNRWDPDRLVTATREERRGRLRLAAGIGLFFTDFSRLGIPWAMETTVALKTLARKTLPYHMAQDPWNNPEGANEPEGLYLEFFKPYGLYVNWPLADFMKQYQWAMIRNHDRVWSLMRQMAPMNAVA